MYGDGKSDFLAEINQLVREKMQPIGINIDYIAIVGNVWLPRNVKAAIDEKVKAGQLAAQREWPRPKPKRTKPWQRLKVRHAPKKKSRMLRLTLFSQRLKHRRKQTEF